MNDAVVTPVRRPGRSADPSREAVRPPVVSRFSPFLPRTELISRQDLLRRLAAWPDHRVTLIEGPAGYGKSTLLAQAWRALEREPVLRLWLTLEAADRGLPRFLQDVAESVAAAGIEPPEWCGVPEEDAARLVDRLAEQGKPVWLALDNHHVAQSSEVDAFIAYVVAHSGAPIHVAIAARSRPQIRLAALTERHALINIKTDALAFTEAETQALCGDHLRREAIDALQARTEGWPAALQLARRRLAAAAEALAVSNGVQGGVGDLRDYIAEEIFAPLPEDARKLLIETVELDRLDAATADAARGRADSAAILADLERRNTLLFPIAGDETGFRFHPLLKDFVRAQYWRLPASEREAMETRSIAFFAAQGHLESALQHLRRICDIGPPLSRLESAPAAAFWRLDRLADPDRKFVEWVEDAFKDAPRSLALRAMAWFSLGRVASALADAQKATVLMAAARGINEHSARAWEAEREREAWVLLQAVVFEEGPSPERLDRAVIAAAEGGRAGVEGALSHSAAVLALRAGRGDAARTIAQTWADKVRKAGDAEAFAAFTQLAFFCLQDAAPRAALDALDEAERILPQPSNGLQQVWSVLRAFATLERDGEMGDRSLPAPETAPLFLGASSALLVDVAHLGARAALKEEGHEAAQAVLDRAQSVAEARNWRIALREIAAERLTFAVQAQAPIEAYVRALKGAQAQTPRIELALARHEAAAGRVSAARERLAALLSRPHLAARWRFAALVLDARAAEADKASDRVSANLDAALQLSGEGAMCASFFEDGADLFGDVVALGARIATTDIDDARVDAVVDLALARARFIGEGELEPPSTAEKAMLRALRKTGARAEAAELLGLSENTLKTHLRRVFQKWSVNDWRIAVKLGERLVKPV